MLSYSPPIPLQLSLKIGYVLLHFCIVAYFATTGGGVQVAGLSITHPIWSINPSSRTPCQWFLGINPLDAPPYTVQYKSVLLLPLFFHWLNHFMAFRTHHICLVVFKSNTVSGISRPITVCITTFNNIFIHRHVCHLFPIGNIVTQIYPKMVYYARSVTSPPLSVRPSVS
jgi:hypothetical protein